MDSSVPPRFPSADGRPPRRGYLSYCDVPDAEGASLLEPSAETRVFALLDAAKIPGLPERLEGLGAEFACLFDGEAAEDYAEAAPYLVDMTDDARLRAHVVTRSSDPLDLLGRNAGVVVTAPCTLAEIRDRLRRFTRIRDGRDRWYYFRFWDAGGLFHFLADDRLPLDTAVRLCQMRDGTALTWIVPHDGRFRIVTPTRTEAAPTGSLVLSDREYDALRLARWIEFERAVADELRADVPEMEVTPGRISELCHRGFALGLRVELALYTFVRATVRAWHLQIHPDTAWGAISHLRGLSQLDRARAYETAVEDIGRQGLP
ncbi:DUF4123 domain-containing protein [Jannaschia aquimarina]|uniref:DUF4123 domain-containing protein n=1 Tax=Jannaschia aquimarina TaxID=935700 RepID=A0A0D1EMG5_9RHOB|nr:DUF4123 domain-containing protein [Jannaschia aquimarina]KIT16875.1 hypothetical protein jaqu_13730 [Jannaschia aquimarina]SNT12560.1 protein of unknown function [Jannaschia aquimarina]